MKKKKKATQSHQTPLEKKQFNIAIPFFIYCLAIIPFFNLNFLIDPALSSKFTALSAGLLVLIIVYVTVIIKARSSVDLSPFKQFIFPIFLLYILISGLSLFKAVNISEAVFDLVKNIVFFTFFLFSALLLANNKNLPLLISKIISVFSFLIIIIGLFQVLKVAAAGVLNDTTTKEVTALFMNKNLYSQILFLALPFNIFGLYILKKRWRTFCSVNSLFTIALIIVLITRSVWVALIVSTLIAATVTYILHLNGNDLFYSFRHKLIKPIIATGSVIVITILLLAITGSLTSSDETTTNDITSSKNRIALWESSLEISRNNPISGVGGGNWKIQIPNYGVYDILKTPGKTRFQRPHNDYLWILAEYGIFGLLAYLSVLVIGLIYLLRIIFLTQKKEDKIFYLLMLFGFVGYITFSFFSYPKERTEHNIYFFFILSLITVKHHQLAAKSPKSITANKLLSFTLAFVLILSGTTFVGFKKISGESHAKLAIDALHAERFETTVSEIENNYSWFYGMDPTATPVLWYKGLANFRKGKTKEALNNFLDATEINPYHSHTFNSIGIIYAQEGDFDRAKKYFLKSLALRPYSTETILNISTIYFQDGEHKKALNELIRIDPETDQDRYKINMVKVLEFEINQLADSIHEPKLHNYILEVKKSKPTTLEIYKASVKEDHSFKAQYLHNIAQALIKNDSTLTEKQKDQLNQYLINK